MEYITYYIIRYHKCLTAKEITELLFPVTSLSPFDIAIVTRYYMFTVMHLFSTKLMLRVEWAGFSS